MIEEIPGKPIVLIEQNAKEKLLVTIQTAQSATQKAKQKQQQLEAEKMQAVGKKKFTKAFLELSRFHFALTAGKIKKMSDEQLVILDQMLVRKAWKDLITFPLIVASSHLIIPFSPLIIGSILSVILNSSGMFTIFGIINIITMLPLFRIGERISNNLNPNCWSYLKFRKTQFPKFLTYREKI